MVILFWLLILLSPRVEAGYLDARYGMGRSPEGIRLPPAKFEISADMSAAYDSGFAVRSKERPVSEAIGGGTLYPVRISWKPFTGKNLWLGLESMGSLNSSNYMERPIYVKNIIRDWRILDQVKKEEGHGASVFFPMPLQTILGLEAKYHRIHETTAFYQLDASGKTMWRFEEKRTVSGQSFRFSTLKEIDKDLFLGVSFNPRARLGDEYSLPASWSLGFSHRQERKFLAADVFWTNYSKIKNQSLFDRKDLQFLAAGNKETISPGLQDAVGLKFQMRSPLSKVIDLDAGARFDSHPVERKLMTPLISLGLGFYLPGGFYFESGTAFSYQDYFGDGILWATDQRVAETRWVFRQRVRWDF